MRGSQPFSSHLAPPVPRQCWEDRCWRWSVLPKDCKWKNLPLLQFLKPWVPTCSSAIITLCLFPPSLLLIESRPTPEISWTKVSGVLPAKRTSFLHYQRTLRIVNVSESDAGDYRCTGRNQLGSVHHTIHVTVKGASVMSCTESHKAVRSPCGNRVTHSACLFILPPPHNWFMQRCQQGSVFSD